MAKKWTREHSTSPKFQRVAWTEKRTRQGAVLAAEVISTPGSFTTPVKPNKLTTMQRVKYSQTPTSGEGIKTAMSLPPIPAPEVLAPKRDRRGKV